MKLFLLTITCFLFLKAQAQTEQGLIEESKSLEAALNENAAFEKVKQVLRLNPNNYYASWKASELCSRIGFRQPTKSIRIQFYQNGKQYAQKAIQVNPSGADGYYALAVAMGRLALILPTKDKINAVRAIKSNAEKAVKLNPQHAGAWHVLGKWHYEVSNLNILEKAGVKFMFGGLPDASIEQSIQAYERAKQFEPNLALNYLELAKAYKRNDEDKKAITLLQKLPSIPNRTVDDNRIKNEGKALLKEWTD